VVTGSLTLQPPFSAGDGSTLAAALLLRPSAGIESLPSLQSEPGAIYPRAIEQFDGLVTALRQCGIQTVVLEAPADDGPVAAGVVVADLAVVLPKGAVLMRPSDPIVRAQVARIEAALEKAGVPVIGRIEAPGLLDGGDVLIGPDALYVGVPQDRASRTGIARGRHGNELGRRQLAAIASDAGLRTVEVGIASDVARLRAVAAFVDRATIVAPPRIVDVAAFASIECIDAPDGEEYGAGVLTVGPRRVLANVRFRYLFAALRRARVAVDAIDLWEFGKIGVTPSLLALALKRT
jgi:dimethylargininase